MQEDVKIQIENYDGPLDLLLSLVKDKHMDIFSIDLSELASAYLSLIDQLKHTDIDLASEYLVMAATLIQLKAKMLLENPSQKAEVEKEKRDLLTQLAEYQQFKKISQELKRKEEIRQSIFIKENEDYNNFQLPIDETKLDGKSDAIKLIMTLRKMFERVNAAKLKETTISKFHLSPEERRIEILDLFRNGNPTFEDIFSVPSMEHFVVTLITLLDMARKQEVILEQYQQFGEIRIVRGEI